MNKIEHKEDGIVSIIVTVILIAVMSLLVLGFSQVARRNQQAVLDKQLNTQAYYAAQTGINEAYGAIKSGIAIYDPLDATDCQKFITDNASSFGSGPVLDTSSNNLIKFTCVLVNTAPSTLEFRDISDSSKAIVFKSTTNQIASLKISWENKDATQNGFGCGSIGSFTTATNWSTPSRPGCSTGVLRTDLIPVDNSFTWTGTNSLDNKALTTFMFPASGAPSNLNYPTQSGYIGSGSIANGGCTSVENPKYCNVTISNINSYNIALRLRSLYIHSSVTITAYDSSGSQLGLSGAQVLIDVTGRSADVLKREAVRVPKENAGPFPDFGVSSIDTICKQIQVDATIAGVGGLGVVRPNDSSACDPTSPSGS
ncbi:MAG: hypothetical protein NVSMB46_01000 [Candidatus Saccharimonadales bacterium]